MLKKQTVWLLTMLSLMVVLSVYYFVAEKDNMAFNEIKQDAEVNEEEEIVIEEMQEVNVNELFTTIRMEIEDERNVKKDRFKEIVASNESTTNEINEALEAINELESITTKEQILQEMMLQSNEALEDVLVRTEEDKVHVHVMTDDLTKQEAVQMMQMVKDELGEREIAINYEKSGK
ncbi:MAG TPA: SpoIIIAH-like family protein [Pseudogracilibacillus sp.]|nr:SpoIIIAH-like family protein [Pseudogracilibacillus sp.]